MPITVKLFAAYRELLGQRELTVEATPGLTVAELFTRTVGDRADQGLRTVTLFAVNESYAPPETVLRDGDHVAFIPPVSGG